MTQNYTTPAVEPVAEHVIPRESRASRRPAIGPAFAVFAADACAIVFCTVMLWLGAGATVLSGQPLVIAVAFAGGSLLAGVASLFQKRSEASTRAVILVHLLYVFGLAAGYIAYLSTGKYYFFAWILLFAGVYLAARAATVLIVDTVAGRRPLWVLVRLVSIAAGVATIVLMSVVWVDSSLMGDLLVFVLLVAVAGLVFEAGVRAFRRVS
jgi:hypothetical protein